MIGTIRKHSAWLWILIAGLTIVSFVVFMGQGPMRSGGGRGATGGYGTLYGRQLTGVDIARARGEFYIFYWWHYGQWPNKAGMSEDEQEREIYIRLLMSQKAAKLGIHVSQEALVGAAGEFLRQVGRGQPMPMQQFVKQYLEAEKLNAGDLENYLRAELTRLQLIQTLGLAGSVVSPIEASQIYDRVHQEVSAQAVFFSASNYLSQVAVTPAALSQFYANHQADYRELDRVQVNYVAFELSNYLAAAEQKFGKTNLEAQVEANFRQVGIEGVRGAKTADEARAKIREAITQQLAANEARQAANEFAAALFDLKPVTPENLVTFAKQKGLSVRLTAPFNANFGPEEFSAPPAFTKSAFQLSADEPFAGPVPGSDAFYVLALAKQLPSSIPPLEQIRPRVTQDFQNQEAVMMAVRAGTNYCSKLAQEMAAGKSFALAAVSAGQAPVVLPPFSLSTTELPELGEHATVTQAKQAAFTTPPGKVSSFTPTADGGFVLFVQQMLPVNAAKKTADLPQFLAQVRQERQREAFNLWLMAEAGRELRDTPFYKRQSAGPGQQP